MSASKRQHRRESKRQLLKQARALHEEWCRLDRKKRDAELVPLDEPYQRGWVRYFRWSDDAMRRKDFDVMEGLLEMIQNKQWSRHPDFRLYQIKGRIILRDWLPRSVYHPHQLLRACSDPHWYQYFMINRYLPLRGEQHLQSLMAAGWNGQLRFKYPEFLEAVVEPDFVTHLKTHDSTLDARMAEIDEWFEQRGGWSFIARTMGWRTWHHEHEREKKLRSAITKEVREELERRGIFRAFRFFGEWWRRWNPAMGCSRLAEMAGREVAYG